jgi:hypothetical protein
MTEIFRSTRKCRTFEAFLQRHQRPPSQVEATGRVNGTRGQRAEDDPDFYPLWVIYGGHDPPWLRVGQSFR